MAGPWRASPTATRPVSMPDVDNGWRRTSIPDAGRPAGNAGASDEALRIGPYPLNPSPLDAIHLSSS